MLRNIFKKNNLLLLVMLYITQMATAQITPAEGSRINYRLIYFSFPKQNDVTNNSIEIAEGTLNNDDDFKTKIIKTLACNGNGAIADVPSFGKSYTWRKVTGGKGGKLNHFSVLLNKHINDTLLRVNVTKPSNRYKDSYIFCDGSRAIYDISGMPVWFLPDIAGEIDSISVIRDLKLTNTGTITFLSANTGYEINYNGKIVWKTPKHPRSNGDSIERYHHELTKLSNGHYMVMGNEFRAYNWRVTSPTDSVLYLLPLGYKHTQPVLNRPAYIQFANIMELDAKGKIVWFWSTLSYFQNMPKGGMTKKHMDSHANSFYLDESKGVLYISVKNTNEVLKVKYPEGKVICAYDGKNTDTEQPFCEQHTCKINRDGNLYIFNNNMCQFADGPNVQVYQEDEKNAKLEKVWDFAFTPERFNLRVPRGPATSGGCATALFDGALFVSLCVPDGNMYIVNENRETEWEGILEKFNPAEGKWRALTFYRASIVTSKKMMDRLVKGNGK